MFSLTDHTYTTMDTSRRLTRNNEIEKLIYSPKSLGITVELFMSALKCLEPNTYLNDEIVQFYTAYLWEQYCREPQRMHIFDSFIHENLRDIFSSESSANDPDKWRQLNKWCNRLDIFTKDFLIFPVCQDKHWFVIIVCHPHEVQEYNVKPLAERRNPKQKRNPGIIVLDSLGCQDRLLTREVRYFLDFQWRTRSDRLKDFFYHDLTQYHPKLPTQTNSFDCGVFMLAYVRAFVKQPDRFYQAVVSGPSKEADLAEMVNGALTRSGREALKNLIKSECTVKKLPTAV